MKKEKRKSLLHSFTEPLNLFYLGFLASIGLAFGSVMIIDTLKKLVELRLGFEILIYSRIAFSIFYLSFLNYTYKFLNMRKSRALRNGFLLFVILFIMGQIYVWI